MLIAGSEAPVGTREPVPFVHMAASMTRSDFVGEDLIALNSDQVLNVHEIIEAYTINGAKALPSLRMNQMRQLFLNWRIFGYFHFFAPYQFIIV